MALLDCHGSKCVGLAEGSNAVPLLEVSNAAPFEENRGPTLSWVDGIDRGEFVPQIAKNLEAEYGGFTNDPSFFFDRRNSSDGHRRGGRVSSYGNYSKGRGGRGHHMKRAARGAQVLKRTIKALNFSDTIGFPILHSSYVSKAKDKIAHLTVRDSSANLGDISKLALGGNPEIRKWSIVRNSNSHNGFLLDYIAPSTINGRVIVKPFQVVFDEGARCKVEMKKEWRRVEKLDAVNVVEEQREVKKVTTNALDTEEWHTINKKAYNPSTPIMKAPYDSSSAKAMKLNGSMDTLAISQFNKFQSLEVPSSSPDDSQAVPKTPLDHLKDSKQLMKDLIPSTAMLIFMV
ncbi:hypothetical protein F0562_001711 [Nyssa sinensis]|uniref:Uncharacterized protein n=1 Tax=Nyssa sinensis TaxID=561372 RepID=A0A5J5C7X7_9ASTE|nr:hypothetical protein F0562_001711 [Nyssa sinensis]